MCVCEGGGRGGERRGESVVFGDVAKFTITPASSRSPFIPLASRAPRYTPPPSPAPVPACWGFRSYSLD